MADAKKIKAPASPAPVAMPEPEPTLMLGVSARTGHFMEGGDDPYLSLDAVLERDAQWQAQVDALTHDVKNGLTEIARQAQEIERLQAACSKEHQAFETLSHRFDVLTRERDMYARANKAQGQWNERNRQRMTGLYTELKALRSAPPDPDAWKWESPTDEDLAALRSAPTGKPVAHLRINGEGNLRVCDPTFDDAFPVYTVVPTGVQPLTEKQIEAIVKEHTTEGLVDGARLFYRIPFARALERAHGIVGTRDADGVAR